ncbi:MAG TPA: hypothetical protein VKB35_05850 [Ktedonobacteraceae bacterium]|nr:hypothetical protein [Ktedonobacteraceae bacterium]
MQKPEHRLLLLREAIKEIASRALFGFAWFALALSGFLRWGRRRIGPVSLGE